MKKIILLTIGLITLQLSAQNIELTILPKSVKVKNDSLHFRYRIHNNSDTVFVLYNIGMVWVVVDTRSTDIDISFETPGIYAFFYDKNGKLPTILRVSTPLHDASINRTQSYEDSIFKTSFGKYVILSQNKTLEYGRRIYIGNYGLIKGTYTFQLEYASLSDYYSQKFKKAKEKDSHIRNGVMFKGEIKSNVCTFEYPYVKRDD